MKRHVHTTWTLETTPFVLNLDPLFKPLIEGYFELGVDQFSFPGGEQHLKIKDFSESGRLVITQRYNKPDDLISILLANDAAKRAGFTKIQLVLPYFPAARQDRVCSEGEPLTVKVFADMINTCGFDKVLTYTPHSDVCPALIDNCHLLDLDGLFLERIITDDEFLKCDNINIVCPDAGAGKRVLTLTKHVAEKFPDINFEMIRCEKVRDVKTGELKDFNVQSDDLNGHPTIILDDVVAYGGTFKGLGVELKKLNCGKLILFTSHADCVDGVQNMSVFFDRFYTSNSKKNWGDYTYTIADRVRCFDIEL